MKWHHSESSCQESLKLPAKLDAMEAALLQQKAELTELKSMAKNAHASRDEAKRQLAQIEGEAYESKRQRDAELSATRKEVERRTAESEKCDKRSTRATLLVDTSDQKALQMTKEQEEKQKVLRYEDAFLRIKEAARVTDIKVSGSPYSSILLPPTLPFYPTTMHAPPPALPPPPCTTASTSPITCISIGGGGSPGLSSTP